MKILINSRKKQNINIFERALQFGDGLFETCLIKNGKMFFWSEHFTRLEKGCKKLKIGKIDENLLIKDINEIKTDNCVIKVIISRGVSLRGYDFNNDIKPTRIVICFDVPKLKNKYELSICSSSYYANPLLAGIKHNNRLEQVLARNSIITDDGVMLDENGFVISVTSGNIFLVKDNILKTPDLTNCGILGIIRQVILSKIKTKVDNITLDELLDADEVFITNSIIGIKTVSKIKDKKFKTHTITNKINEIIF